MPRLNPRQKLSIGLIRQKFPAHDNAHPVTLGIGLALQVHVEIDGAHDAVAEFFVDQGFEGGAVDVKDGSFKVGTILALTMAECVMSLDDGAQDRQNSFLARCPSGAVIPNTGRYHASNHAQRQLPMRRRAL